MYTYIYSQKVNRAVIYVFYKYVMRECHTVTAVLQCVAVTR